MHSRTCNKQATLKKRSKQQVGKRHFLFTLPVFAFSVLSPLLSSACKQHMNNPFLLSFSRFLWKKLLPCSRNILTTIDERKVQWKNQLNFVLWLSSLLRHLTTLGTFMKRMKILFYRSTADSIFSIFSIFHRIVFCAISFICSRHEASLKQKYIARVCK